jgi:hypothetical protein
MTHEEVLHNIADAIRAVERQGKRADKVYIHPVALSALIGNDFPPDPRGFKPLTPPSQYLVFGLDLRTKPTLREDEVEIVLDPVFDPKVLDT